MTWLVSGQIFGIVMATLMRDRSMSDTIMRDFRSGNSAKRKALITDQLLQRLGIDTNQDSRRKLESLVPSDPTPGFLIFLMKTFPEFVALYVYMVNALVYGVCGLWGFVIVGQMLLNYGNCIRVY